jgi:hypothetical protein
MGTLDPNNSNVIITEAFGTSAANPTYITLPLPVADQTGVLPNLASFATGFPPSTMTPEASGGEPFFGQDMNGLLYMITSNIASFAAGYLPTYDATRATAIGGYNIGAVVLNATKDGFWLNLVANNLNNPDTTPAAGWVPLATILGASVIALSSANHTLTEAELGRKYIAFTGTITTNLNVIFPTNAGQDWIVANFCTGAFTVTCKTASGTGVIVPATGSAAPTSVFCDGANICNTGVSTAGLAPINSPALTGTPTGPTAASDTNTTQLATCAFVQQEITEELATYAPLASPTLTGVPTAPTPSANDNSAKLATTQYVDRAVATVPQIRNGITATLSGGANTITYATPFPNFGNPPVISPFGNSASFAVTSYSRTGFTMNTGAATPFTYIATGG